MEKFDLRLGRKTLRKIFAAYWPYSEEEAPHAERELTARSLLPVLQFPFQIHVADQAMKIVRVHS